MHLRDQRGVAFIAEIILVALVVVAVGFAIYAASHRGTANKATQGTPSPEPMANWKTYTSSLEKLSFKYPSSWTKVDTVESNVPGADVFAVQSPGGVKVSWIAAADGLGGGCNPDIAPGTKVSEDELTPCPYWTVTDKQKLAGANLYFVDGIVTNDGTTYRPWCALQASDGILASGSDIGYLMFPGLHNDYVDASGKHNPESAALVCGRPFGGETDKNGAKEEAEALLQTADYQTAKQILLSATY